MVHLRAFLAAAILVPVAAALPGPALAQAQSPLQQLSDLADQARAADEAHAQAAKVCDLKTMQRELNTLNRLAREADQIADAARAAGSFAAIDPLNAARIAATIATRTRVAATRPPENCPTPEEQMRQQSGPPGMPPGTQPPTLPLPRPVRRAPTVDDALTANFEHAKAADRCDREAMARLLAELERLAHEAEMEMHSWDGMYTRSAWDRAASVYSEILRILDAARNRQARNCTGSGQSRPGQLRDLQPRSLGPMQQGNQPPPEQQGTIPQQEKQRQQQGTQEQPQQQQQETVEQQNQRQPKADEQPRRKKRERPEKEEEEQSDPGPGSVARR